MRRQPGVWCHGGAAQSVVSISDFRQDASGARVAEGTGSGVIWDRSVWTSHGAVQLEAYAWAAHFLSLP